jgi:hypothetical protein
LKSTEDVEHTYAQAQADAGNSPLLAEDLKYKLKVQLAIFLGPKTPLGMPK